MIIPMPHSAEQVDKSKFADSEFDREMFLSKVRWIDAGPLPSLPAIVVL
jgi:hypothetical protein